MRRRKYHGRNSFNCVNMRFFRLQIFRSFHSETRIRKSLDTFFLSSSKTDKVILLLQLSRVAEHNCILAQLQDKPQLEYYKKKLLLALKISALNGSQNIGYSLGVVCGDCISYINTLEESGGLVYIQEEKGILKLNQMSILIYLLLPYITSIP